MAVVMRGNIFKRKVKYGNKKVVADGITFDSCKEWLRYTELQLALRSGLIDKLEVHPKFELVVNGFKVCNFTADFSYIKVFSSDDGPNKIIVEDVKSKPTMTPVYRIKKKLVKALFGIDVKEIL
jgi:hypothetical protein